MNDKTKPRKRASRKEAESSTKEQEYMRQFINYPAHVNARERYLMTEIAPCHIRKIRQILFSVDCGRACSVKSYINNVLEAHFKEYAGLITTKISKI